MSLLQEVALEQHDVERIARAAMKELGLPRAEVAIEPGGRPGQWLIDVRGAQGPSRLKITCGQGSSPQWIRDQIFEQMT